MEKSKGFLFVKAVLGLVAAFFVVYGVAAFVNYMGYAVVRRVKPAVVCLPTGSTLPAQALALQEAGAVADTAEFLNYARKMGYEAMMPGKYEFDGKTTYRELLRRLSLGLQTPVNMTFTASRTLGTVAKKLSRNIEPDSAALAAVLRDDSLARRYGFDSVTFPGMLVPNTYQVFWNISPEGVVDRLNREYEAFWERDGREAKRKRLGLDRNEVMTLASIVYEESKVPEDMRRIAGVYLNRLRIGMKLQADPTAKYATGDWSISRVLHAHTRIVSPYNTYVVKGLPPGPIVVPSIDAVDAVLDYEPSDDLYFCASPEFDGTHRFAPDLAGHNKNVRDFRKAYRERERERKNR